MESGSRFGSSLGLANRRIERPRHLPARSLSSQQLGPTAGGSPSARRVRQLLELGSKFTCPNPSPVPTPGSRHQRHLDINPNGNTLLFMTIYDIPSTIIMRGTVHHDTKRRYLIKFNFLFRRFVST